jgi:oligoendopeptidase F
MRDRATTTFVPDDLDAADWSALGPLYEALGVREAPDREAFRSWLMDRSELEAAAGEAEADLYIRMTCHTDDASASGAWTRYLEEVQPRRKRAMAALDERHVEIISRVDVAGDRLRVLNRDVRNDVEMFRPDNVPLETELGKLDQEYDRVCGDMTVEFEGETRTLPQMARFLQVTDREVRERAWRAVGERRLADRGRIDGILEQMLVLRQRIASNAGFGDFRDYQHKRLGRFDYTPDECFAFHEAVERHCVPFVRRLEARRRERLGVGALRPWDLAVDELGREPLRPFEGGQELVEKSRRAFGRLDPRLGDLFAELGDNLEPGGCLDLDSRKGKASGGYQYMRDRSRRPFIFMNAAGLHRDVETMVHEAGHAFHSLLCRGEPLVWYRHSDIEFAEVASMAMELLSMPHWDEFYPDAADADRARRKQLEGSISMLPWIATIDAFQQWMYTNPGHSGEERTACWLGLDGRFGAAVDWSGLEDARASAWQRQGHLFGVPFYYIEYGIAQLGALGIWLNSLERGPGEALEAYKSALSLGGSRPLPELFEAAGVPFDFGEARVGELVAAVEAELSGLPA